MARTFGRIQTAIWKDRDFIALDERPQRLYMFLLAQDDLTHAGLIPLRVKRWASKSPSLNEAGLLEALDVLEATRFVVVDHETEELLIRTYVRNDGVYKQPKVMLRMREDAKQIESPKLRAAFRGELDRLPLNELNDRPGGSSGDLMSTQAAVRAVVDTLHADLADPDGDPTEGVSDTPRQGYGEPPRGRAGAFPLPPAPFPQPPTPVPPTAGDVVAATPTALAETQSAQTLVAEWIDHCGKRPPEKVIGQVSALLHGMLEEGIDYAEVRAGLAAWQQKGLHPATLPSVVHETRTQHTRAVVSTTDARVAAVQALKGELRPTDQRSIGA